MNPSVEVEIKRVAQDSETLTVISLPTFPPFFRPSTSASIVVHFTLPPAVYRKMRLCSFVYVFIYMYIYTNIAAAKGETLLRMTFCPRERNV